MPPKAKFERKEVVQCALKIIEEDGFDALTARNLGEKLGSSARPIFTIFKNMEEVTSETLKEAYEIYRSYLESGLKEEIAFKGSGMAYIRFADEHPKLFQLLFMKENQSAPDLSHVLQVVEKDFNAVLGSLTNTYGVDDKTALKLYQHAWIYSHGIAVLVATKVCKFTQEEISRLLSEMFVGLLKSFKSEGK